MKRTSKIKRIAVLGLIFLMSINSFATSVNNNDGSAFITKAEFDALKSSFQAQIDKYNQNIDSKIDSAITSYLSGIRLISKQELPCLLNTLSADRRTFIGKIELPTTDGQQDLKITSNGFWGTTSVNDGNGGHTSAMTHGYMFIGFNNYISGHLKGPVEASNGKDGYFCATDTIEIKGQLIYYLREKKLKQPIVKVFSWYSGTEYDVNYGKWPKRAKVSSITWDNDGPWVGENNRTVGRNTNGNNRNFPALESINLLLSNGDTISWANNTAGDVVASGTFGCLDRPDQYVWTHKMTNQHYGEAGSQCYVTTSDPALCGKATYNNDYNGYELAPEYFNLNFNVPKITMLSFDTLCQLDTSLLTGQPTTYYNGLPLCNITSPGHIKMKFKLNRSDVSGDVDVAIANEPFKNFAINADTTTKILFKETINAGDEKWGGTNNGIFEIELDVDQLSEALGKTLWIKCYCHNGSTAYNVELSVIEIMHNSVM